MKMKRREIIRLGAGVAAFGGLGSLLASEEPMLKTSIPSSGQQVPAVGISTVRFRGDPGSPAMQRYRETLAVFHSLGGRLPGAELRREMERFMDLLL